jgi:hypothetical protein
MVVVVAAVVATRVYLKSLQRRLGTEMVVSRNGSLEVVSRSYRFLLLKEFQGVAKEC